MKIKYTIINKKGEIEEVNSDSNIEKKKTRKIPFLYLDFGIYLIIPILLGIAGGKYLDNRFNTKPLFTLILIFLGTIITFYNLYKIANNGNKSTH